MSGLEVVGVVLGAVPIIIHALESCRKLGRVQDAFTKRSLHIAKMVKALRTQQALIDGDVKLVLRDSGVDAKKISYYQSLGRMQELLRQDDVSDAVAAYLGDSYGLYLEIMQDCHKTILDIALTLRGLQEGSCVRTVTLAGMIHDNSDLAKPGSELKKKFKFSMRKEDIDRSIRELDDYSRLLERLRERTQHENLVVLPASSSSRRIVSGLNRVQKHVLNLHHALARSLTQDCTDAHEARLYLDCRVDELARTRSKALAASSSSSSSNGIVFGVSLRPCSSAAYKTCIIEANELHDTDRPTSPSPSFKTTSVSFESSTCTLSVPRGLDIFDMCATLTESITRKKGLKFYLNERRLGYEYAPESPVNPRLAHRHSEDKVSLRDLLQDPAYRYKMYMKPRVRLAATIAASALQLHATPWCSGLKNECFLFARDETGEVDLRNPFVVCSVFEDSGASSASSFKNQSEDESKLLDLGILILEVWHQERIESWAERTGLDLKKSLDSRRSIANIWIAETKENLLTSVHEAAVICVNCRLNAAKIDFADRRQGESIYESVIKPLLHDCRD